MEACPVMSKDGDWMRPGLKVMLLVFLLIAAACGETQPAATTAPPTGSRPMAARADVTAVPWHGLDGNRLVVSAGRLDLDSPIDVPLEGRPSWLVGAVVEGDPIWVVVTEDGRATSIRVSSPGSVETRAIGRLDPSAPPVLAVRADGVDVVSPRTGESPFAAPFAVSGSSVAVLTEGDVRVGDTVFKVNALPDARIVSDGDGRVLVLTGATDRYAHGVVGDELEATSVTLFDLEAETAARIVEVAADQVIEGVAPIWADVDGDGAREVIVTISTAAEGARVTVFDETGRIVAESEPIGRGGRWRHQIAAVPTGPGGEMEIVDVLTPHIGGVVEFFRRVGTQLEIVASVGGFTSHFIGSRNLSIPLAADGDGDGRPEAILPEQSLTAISGIQRTDRGAEIAWTAPLAGRLSSNLAMVALPDGRPALAAGRADGTVRIWLPVS